jgi:hypothetical protein
LTPLRGERYKFSSEAVKDLWRLGFPTQDCVDSIRRIECGRVSFSSRQSLGKWITDPVASVSRAHCRFRFDLPMVRYRGRRQIYRLSCLIPVGSRVHHRDCSGLVVTLGFYGLDVQTERDSADAILRGAVRKSRHGRLVQCLYPSRGAESDDEVRS